MDIQSKEVIDKISEELKVQPSLAIPRALMEKIQLVYDVCPPRVVDLIESASTNTAGTSTIFTTSAEKDTFISKISWSLQADVTNDGTSATVDLVLPDGRVRNVISLIKLSALEQLFEKVITFDPPIKLKRNTPVRHGHVFIAGSSSMSTVVFGYTTDPL